jgi:hypothetical protein
MINKCVSFLLYPTNMNLSVVGKKRSPRSSKTFGRRLEAQAFCRVGIFGRWHTLSRIATTHIHYAVPQVSLYSTLLSGRYQYNRRAGIRYMYCFCTHVASHLLLVIQVTEGVANLTVSEPQQTTQKPKPSKKKKRQVSKALSLSVVSVALVVDGSL